MKPTYLLKKTDFSKRSSSQRSNNRYGQSLAAKDELRSVHMYVKNYKDDKNTPSIDLSNVIHSAPKINTQRGENIAQPYYPDTYQAPKERPKTYSQVDKTSRYIFNQEQ